VTRPNSPDFKLAERFVDSLIDIHMEVAALAKNIDNASQPDSVGPIGVPQLRRVK